MNTDRIEKKVLLDTGVERVWRAISDAREFGRWFGVRFEGEFVAGQYLHGTITPTQVDEAVAAMQKPHEGMPFEFFVESVEPMHRMALRWHPFAVDRTVDYSNEPTTLIEFILQPTDGGTLLTITESGFDRIPLHRRAMAFAANDQGWSFQIQLIQKYLAIAAPN